LPARIAKKLGGTDAEPRRPAVGVELIELRRVDETQGK
jgi:hypothetical protein